MFVEPFTVLARFLFHLATHGFEDMVHLLDQVGSKRLTMVDITWFEQSVQRKSRQPVVDEIKWGVVSRINRAVMCAYVISNIFVPVTRVFFREFNQSVSK